MLSDPPSGILSSGISGIISSEYSVMKSLQEILSYANSAEATGNVSRVIKSDLPRLAFRA